mgnify:CR=1 FL=1
MSGLLLALALVTAPPAGAVRYCVTPLWPWPQGTWIRAMVDVAPEKAVLQKGATAWLRFGSEAEARAGARGACWWLVKTTVAGKPNARKVVGYAP